MAQGKNSDANISSVKLQYAFSSGISPMRCEQRPLVGSSLKDIQEFPEGVKDEIGFALYLA
jgi:hypothetical protein